MSYKKFTNEQRILWSYWTKVHEIFTRYSGINYAVNAHIEVAISHCQSDEWRVFATILLQKLVAMTTSLKILEKEGRIDYLQFDTYHMV